MRASLAGFGGLEVAEAPTVEDGHTTLLCYDLGGETLECPRWPETDPSWGLAISTAEQLLIEKWDDPEPLHWAGTLECGPMVLEGRCCWTMGFAQEHATGTTWTGR